MERWFAIIGHRAPSSGPLNLNDLAGSGGRMDVLARAVNSALFVSHGIRVDSHVLLHLMGGEGPSRRIWFNGSKLGGVRPDERSISGQIKAILKESIPPRDQFKEYSSGILTLIVLTGSVLLWDVTHQKISIDEADSPTSASGSGEWLVWVEESDEWTKDIFVEIMI